MATSKHEPQAHPWKIVDPSDGSVVASCADRSLAMVRTHYLLAPLGPYPRLSLQCDAFAPRDYRAGDIGDHAREEYLVDCQQYILSRMHDHLTQIADDAAQLAGELAQARDALRTLSDDMIDDGDDLVALNEVGSRIIDRYARHDLVGVWYSSLNLIRESARLDVV